MFNWPIDKWKKLSTARRTCDDMLSCDSWKRNRRVYRKKLIANSTVEVYPLCAGLCDVRVKGMCVAVWSSAQQGHTIMDAVFNTITAMEGKEK